MAEGFDESSGQVESKGKLVACVSHFTDGWCTIAQKITFCLQFFYNCLFCPGQACTSVCNAGFFPGQHWHRVNFFTTVFFSCLVFFSWPRMWKTKQWHGGSWFHLYVKAAMSKFVLDSAIFFGWLLDEYYLDFVPLLFCLLVIFIDLLLLFFSLPVQGHGKPLPLCYGHPCHFNFPSLAHLVVEVEVKVKVKVKVSTKQHLSISNFTFSRECYLKYHVMADCCVCVFFEAEDEDEDKDFFFFFPGQGPGKPVLLLPT